MSRQPKHVDVTTYLVVEPEWSQYNHGVCIPELHQGCT